MGFVDLWKWEGKVGRRRYALVGLIGFAIKHNIDRLIAASFFKTSQRDVVGYWFNYWAPLGNAARLGHLSPTEAKFLTTMLVLSLPSFTTRNLDKLCLVLMILLSPFL